MPPPLSLHGSVHVIATAAKSRNPPRGPTKPAGLPSGGWIVSSWRIRSPYVERRRFSFRGRAQDREDVAAIREEGSQVLEVLDPSGRSTGFMRLGGVRGVVRDGTRDRPLAGAEVSLVGSPLRTTTDDAGRFDFPAVPPGEYPVTFRHPRQEELRYVPPPPSVMVRPGLVEIVDLAIPADATADSVRLAGAEAAAEIRPARLLPPGVGSWLTGWVIDADTGEPVPGMALRLQGATEVTDSAGRFHFRGLRPGRQVVGLEHIAYDNGAAVVEVSAMRETYVRLAVTPRAIDLGEIVATGQAERRSPVRSMPANVQIADAEELRLLALRGARVPDVAREMVGVNVMYGRFYGPGHEDQLLYIACIQPSRPNPLGQGSHNQPWCNMVEVFIDGVSIRAAGQVLRATPIGEYERVEYVPPLGATRWGYRAATETGALLLWTKR